MRFFEPDLKRKSSQHKQVYALYELAHTAVDLAAAILFVVGSILFFYKQLQDAGTWCFLVGSIFFAAKPTLKVVREVHLLKIRDYNKLDDGDWS